MRISKISSIMALLVIAAALTGPLAGQFNIAQEAQAATVGTIYDGVGNWTITSNTVASDEVMIIEGFVVIQDGDLTLDNITLSAYGIIVEANRTLDVMDCFINNTEITLAGNNQLTVTNTTFEGFTGVFGTAGDVVIRDCYMNGSLYLAALFDSDLEVVRTQIDNTFSPIFVDQSERVVIENTTIRSTYEEAIILMNVTDARIEDTTIMYSNLSGIRLNDSTVQIARTQIIECGDGIYSLGNTSLDISDSIIQDNNPLNCDYGTIDGPAFGVGILQFQGQLKANNVHMDNNTNFAIASYFAETEMTNSNISQGGYDAFKAYESDVEVINNTFYNNSGYAIDIQSPGTHSVDDNTFISNGANYVLRWSLTVYVNDSYGDPVDFASLTVENIEGDSIVAHTAANGIGAAVLKDTEIDGNGTETVYWPYTITVEKAATNATSAFTYTETASVDLDGITEVFFDLDFIKPDIRWSGMELSDTPTVGGEVEIDITLENIGEAFADGVEVRIYEGRPDGVRGLMKKTYLDILPGETETISIIWSPGIGDLYNISVEIDPLGYIDEKTTTNNKGSEIFEVKDRSKELVINPYIIVALGIMIAGIALGVWGMTRGGEPEEEEPDQKDIFEEDPEHTIDDAKAPSDEPAAENTSEKDSQIKSDTATKDDPKKIDPKEEPSVEPKKMG